MQLQMNANMAPYPLNVTRVDKKSVTATGLNISLV